MEDASRSTMICRAFTLLLALLSSAHALPTTGRSTTLSPVRSHSSHFNTPIMQSSRNPVSNLRFGLAGQGRGMHGLQRKLSTATVIPASQRRTLLQTAIPPRYACYPGLDIAGTSIAFESQNDATSCANACDQVAGCELYTINSKAGGGNCFLKSNPLLGKDSNTTLNANVTQSCLKANSGEYIHAAKNNWPGCSITPAAQQRQATVTDTVMSA